MRLPGLAEDGDLAGGRCEQSLENFDGCGLPCTIRAEQSEALAGSNRKRQATQGLDFAVVGFAQIAALDGGGHGGILAEEWTRRSGPEKTVWAGGFSYGIM